MLANGETIDVKTKATSVPPLPHYECSVSKTNATQKCDHYAFARIHNQMDKGWVLGYLSKDDFFKSATYYEKGDKDASNGFVFRASCYSVPISILKPIGEII